jgi:hypothetical protein
MQMNSGKWYWEATLVTSFGIGYETLGIANSTMALTGGTAYVGSSGSYGYQNDGGKYANGTYTASYGATFTSGDVIGVAFDATAGSLTFYKNNVSQGVAFTGITSGLYFPAIEAWGSTWAMNFGQQGFKYTPPSGFVALNTYNLPTPAIVQGNQYMDATIYNGTGVANTIMNAGSFQPDFIWAKERSATRTNCLTDSVRGFTKYLYSDSTGAEETYSTLVTSANSNGFSVGTSVAVNDSGQTYVGWQWKANGAVSAGNNTSGTITSTVSANTTSGFSVVTYTGNATNSTVGHGLGVAPSLIIFKSRSNTSTNWIVYHVSLGNANTVYLNLTNSSSSTVAFNSTSPTSSVFTIGALSGDNNFATWTYVAYCFAPIAGFSAFGSYTGNGSTSGPFIYCGFKPRWIMIKTSSGVNDWYIWDTARNTYNSLNLALYADLSDAEYTYSAQINVLSNGFNLVGTASGGNSSGATYIYAAFASNPFKYSNAF